MADTRDSKGVPIDTIDIVDPLGSIRALAKELWIEDGEDDSKDWRDFWRVAEKQLTIGLGSNIKPVHKHAEESVKKERSTILRALDDSTDNFLLSVIASQLEDLLIEHEAECLGNILQSNTVELVNGEILGERSLTETAEILAALTKEYDDHVLTESDLSDTEVLKERKEYWIKKLDKMAKDDIPLTYADQNTIARLVSTIERHSQIKTLQYDYISKDGRFIQELS